MMKPSKLIFENQFPDTWSTCENRVPKIELAIFLTNFTSVLVSHADIVAESDACAKFWTCL